MTTLEYLQNKYGLDLSRPSPIEIPNVSRLELGRWFRELGFTVGAEIGVASGEFSKNLCEMNPQIKIYGVDPWKPYRGYRDYTSHNTFTILKDEATRRLTPYANRGRYEFVEDFSEEASKRFEDGSLDFVYIDANHQAPFVDQDIALWAPKVRQGGIVAGHDYAKIKRVDWGVKEAVNKYVTDNNIIPWFILGLSAELPGFLRDGSRSWMWVRT